MPNGIVGLDGHVPIFDPNRRFTIWNISEIYMGKVAENKYIPKVDDLVMDIGSNSFIVHRVAFVNPLNLLSTLVEVKIGNVASTFTNQDLLVGLGPVTSTDTYRVYLDTTVLPFVMAVDARLVVPGVLAKKAKIFKGTNTNENDNPICISRVYDVSGHLISDTIELVSLEMDSHINNALKTVPIFNANETLPDGEIVTIVIYDDLGVVVSKRQLMIENTGFTPRPENSVKYVTSVSLESPFLSITNDTLIEYPINAPITSLSIYGIVKYSDSTTLKLPVDGTKFKLYGLEQYISTIVGHRHDLVLAYTLSEDEKSYGIVSHDNKVITKPYSITTVKPNHAYSVKLFVYPRFVSEEFGYKLHFYLLNLDRNLVLDVTGKVILDENTGVYDPKGYGHLQRRSISINLKNASENFRHYIHTQLADIVLREPPNLDRDSFTVAHESAGASQIYGITTSDSPDVLVGQYDLSRSTGAGIQAIIQVPATDRVKLDCLDTNIDAWLNRVYYTTYPLMDRYLETKPPVPSHFIVIYKGLEKEFPITAWNEVIDLETELVYRESLLVKFIRRTPTNDMYLSVNVFHLVA